MEQCETLWNTVQGLFSSSFPAESSRNVILEHHGEFGKSFRRLVRP